MPFCPICNRAMYYLLNSLNKLSNEQIKYKDDGTYLYLCHAQFYFQTQMSRFMTKSTKWHVRPAKTQISLGIRPV